jgi:hypothetical protein
MYLITVKIKILTVTVPSPTHFRLHLGPDFENRNLTADLD